MALAPPSLSTYRSAGLAPVVIAAAMLMAWAAAVAFGTFVMPWTSSASPLLWAARIGWMALETHLYVGLFIVAHESMHGLAAPGHPRVNAGLGRAALFLYAGFRLAPLLAAHLDHHAFPASVRDPDWSAKGAGQWFVDFIARHSSVLNIVYFAALGAVILAIGVEFEMGIERSIEGYIFGVVIPAVLSAGQLFFFGTYLPHKQRKEGYNDQRAVSLNFPRWLSYLTCYHFGYHYEHHAMPWVPWWKMPKARAQSLVTKEQK